MRRKISLLLGNFLEFYDFTLFAYLIPVVAPLLFPSKEITDSYMTGYIFLAIGFVSRPFGAVLFGYIGDLYGRKHAVILSIFLMSIATITISFLPVASSNWSIVFTILAICRILQGLSAGGEYSGTGLLLIEHTEEKNKFLGGAILTASGLLGAFTASLTSAIMNITNYSADGWRILFFSGGIIGFVALWLRLTVQDYHYEIKDFKKANFNSWITLFTKYRESIVLVIFCSALMNVPFQIITGFLNSYLVATGDFTKINLMFINAIIILFCAIITIIFGFCTKFFNPINMMISASMAMVLFAFPFFLLIKSKSLYSFLGAEILLILMSQCFVAPAFATMAKLFPYELRYRGLAISNCLGLAIFGGSTPYICAYLIKNTAISWSPAFYLIFIAALGFGATLIIKQKVTQNINMNFIESGTSYE